MLISILCSRTKKQLGLVDAAFRSLYAGRNLQEVIASECGGNYKNFLQYACQSREEYMYGRLLKAMNGLGCDESLVNEVFCTATTEEILGMKTLYEQRNDSQLSDKLRKELSGEHEVLILYLLHNGRGNGPADEGQASERAAQLYHEISTGGGMMGGLKDTAKRNVRRTLNLSVIVLLCRVGGLIFVDCRWVAFCVSAHLHSWSLCKVSLESCPLYSDSSYVMLLLSCSCMGSRLPL
jgi:hypothetical protein